MHLNPSTFVAFCIILLASYQQANSLSLEKTNDGKLGISSEGIQFISMHHIDSFILTSNNHKSMNCVQISIFVVI